MVEVDLSAARIALDTYLASNSNYVLALAANNALALAQANGSQNLANAVTGVLGQSASAPGEFVAYSGVGNYDKALSYMGNLAAQGLPGYMIQNTDAGRYAQNPDVAYGLGTEEQEALESVVSAMLGAEAVGISAQIYDRLGLCSASASERKIVADKAASQR